jgi:hypothetical protein
MDTLLRCGPLRKKRLVNTSCCAKTLIGLSSRLLRAMFYHADFDAAFYLELQ